MSMERIQTGHAALAVDSGDTPSQESTIVHGVAIGEGDVTFGGSGRRTYWPRETLEDAAEGLAGRPLATDTDHTADNPNTQTPVEAIAGEVTWADYEPGVGVVYEAEVDDEALAQKIQNGRLEVSPLVFRELEALSDDRADFKATDIKRWRDLALVANGAAPSNEIQVGESPMQAEALHGLVESLQDSTPPEQAQTNAQAAVDIRDKTDAMTDTGWRRASQLADGESLSDDVIERMAQFKRHQSNTEYENYSDVPESRRGEDAENPWWEDNGTVAWFGWGGTAGVEWAVEQSQEMDESMSQHSEALQRATAREPTFDGTETSEEQPWGEVSKDLADWTDALGVDADTVADMTTDQKEAVARHTLLGDASADSWGELSFFPVVNPNNQNLNEGALNAVRGGRGESASIPDDAYSSAEDMAATLLAENFANYEMENGELMSGAESMADVGDVSEDTLVKWNSSGDRPAFGRVVDVRGEGDEPLDGEIDGDQTITPPAALIEVHQPTDDGFEATDTMVGHKLNTDTLTVIEDLPDPESLAMHEENMAEVPESMQFDNPGEAMAKAQELGLEEIHTHGSGEDTVFMPGSTHEDLMEVIQSDDGPEESMGSSSVAGDSNEETDTMDNISETDVAVLEAAESLDAPVEALEEYAATEQPVVVEAETYESMRGVLEDALSEKADLKDDTIEALAFGALVDEFRTEDGELEAEALVQNPETGDAPSAESGVEALGDDADVDKAEALFEDYQRFGNDRLQDDIVEALGVNDWDAAIEVLD